jgi:hypothetical protein
MQKLKNGVLGNAVMWELCNEDHVEAYAELPEPDIVVGIASPRI